MGEEAVIGTILAHPGRAAEVATDLNPPQFHTLGNRMLFDAIQRAYFADTPIDPVAIATPIANPLSQVWDLSEPATVERVQSLADSFKISGANTPLREYASLIRRYADSRGLLQLADGVRAEVERGEMEPGAIAGVISQRALAIATNTVVASEIVDFAQAGRNFIHAVRFEQEASRKNIDLGVRTQIAAIDQFTRGMRPGRLYMSAGEPGVGKSAVWWIAALNFASAQARKPRHQQIGTLILSMEMGDQDSSTRFAQHIANIDGQDIQDANLSGTEMDRLVNEWGKRKEIPLYLNYAPNLKCSQIMAVVAEAIRRHNVGFVVVDHFRTFDLDKRLDNKVDEDEEKARFLKEQIARSMNVAVVCLAHTRKPDAQRNPSGRPHMSDLRGSGQIAAHADVVCFLYRPMMYADAEAIDAGEVSETDAEIIYRKNRQGPIGTGQIFFDPSKMNIH